MADTKKSDPPVSVPPTPPTRRRLLGIASRAVLVALGGSNASPAVASPQAPEQATLAFPLGYYTFPEIAQRLSKPDAPIRCAPALREKVALLYLKPRAREALLLLLAQGLDLSVTRRDDGLWLLDRTPESVAREVSARARFCAYLNRRLGGPTEALFPFQKSDFARLTDVLPDWEAAAAAGQISVSLRNSPTGQKLAPVVSARRTAQTGPVTVSEDALWLEAARDFVEGVKQGRGALALATLWRTGSGAPGVARVEKALARRRVVELATANAPLSRSLGPELEQGLNQIIFGLDIRYSGDVGGYTWEPHLTLCTADRVETPLPQWQSPLIYRDLTLARAALGDDAARAFEIDEKATRLFLKGPRGQLRFRITNRSYPLNELKLCHVLEDWTGDDREIIAEQYPTLQNADFFAGNAAVRALTDAFTAVTLRGYPEKTLRYPSSTNTANAKREGPPVSWSLQEAFAALTPSRQTVLSQDDSGSSAASRNPFVLREQDGVLLVTNRWAFLDRTIPFPDAALLQLERRNPTDGLDYGTYVSYYASVSPADDALWKLYSLQGAPRSLLRTSTISGLRVLHEALLALPLQERRAALAAPPPNRATTEYQGQMERLGRPAIQRIAAYGALSESGWEARLWHPEVVAALAKLPFRITTGPHLGRLRRLRFQVQGSEGFSILVGGDFLPTTVPESPVSR